MTFVVTKSNLIDSLIRVWTKISTYDAFYDVWYSVAKIDTSALYIITKVLLYIPFVLQIVGLIVVVATVKSGSDDDAGVNIVKLGMAMGIFLFFVTAVMAVVALPFRIANIYGITGIAHTLIVVGALVGAIVIAIFFKVFIDVVNIGFESMARGTIASKIPAFFVIGIAVVALFIVGCNVWMFTLTGEILPFVAGLLRAFTYVLFIGLMLDCGREVK